ncbi:MAG: metallophosphoesterase, partial [Polyangia bacterium]|nr:metallophosphoesterase [Polyangia bacterium]
MPQAAEAANPGSAAYSRDGGRLFWILHISDTHIGAQWILDVYDETARFEWLLDEGVAVINPTLILHTGDLVDGSPNGVPGSGQDDAEWTEYRSLVDGAGMTPDTYMDLAGNHDGYGDPGQTHYLASSLQGETYGQTTRTLSLQFPFGDYLIYGASTPGEDGALFLDHAEWSGDELVDLTMALTAHSQSDLVFVFGHHPFKEPTNGDQAENLLQQHQAMYFHGHVHAFGSYLQSNVWSAQVNTLGKGKTNNVAVIAVDNNAVAYAATGTEDPWPLVVITAPVSRRLD